MLRRVTPIKYFSIYSNKQQSPKDFINGKEVQYDHNISSYGQVIQVPKTIKKIINLKAFLEKRWIKKEEIAPKMYIIEPLASIMDSLAQQKLCHLTALLDETRLRRMNESDSFNSQYLISITCEDHFKNMTDQYLSKVLVNGRMPPMKQLDEYNKIKNQVNHLLVYLQERFFNFIEHFSMVIISQSLNEKLKSNTCHQNKKSIIDIRDQSMRKINRRIESMINWRARDPNLFDDYRPIFEDMNFQKRIIPQKLIMKLEKKEFHQLLKFELVEKRKFENNYLDWVVQFLFSRMMLYIHSLEFISIMNLPPDFHIEYQVINLHVWILLDRLKSINTPQSQEIIKLLEQQFKQYVDQEMKKINLRRDKQNYYQDIDLYIQQSRKYFDYHFNMNEKTKENNLYKIDALVWTVVFLEKVPRYNEQVYLMAEYLKSNYDSIKQYDFSRFLACNTFFDVYRMDFNFMENITKINPQLSLNELNKEKLSNNSIKKYEYSYGEEEQIIKPYKFFEKSTILKTVDKAVDSINYTYKKYLTLTTYDHFSSHEEQQKYQTEISNKYAWGSSSKDDLQISQIKKILIERKQK